MHSKISKAAAIERLRRLGGTQELRQDNTHFANINGAKEVWWYDIPLNKVLDGKLDYLNILAYDFRTDDLMHLKVPTEFVKSSLAALVVRDEKQTISLELSAGKTDFMRDIRPGGGKVQFSMFLCS